MCLLKIKINYIPKKQFSIDASYNNSIQNKCIKTTNGAILWLVNYLTEI